MNARFALAPAALAALIGSMAAHAQTAPTAYLERSQVLPTGNVIHAYRVPTTDVNGKVRYSDLEITLSVNDAGRVGTSAGVVAVASPKVLGNNFVKGTYKAPDGALCTVDVSFLGSGRQQVSVACGTSFSATIATGDIAGHPFELDLVNAGIGQISGYRDYAWGKIGDTRGFSWWGCMNTGEVISAVQAGDQLNLNGYDRGNVQLCGVTLTRQP